MQINFIRDSSNSLDLRYAVSANEVQARRFLVFANGRSEWIEKYEPLFKDLHLSEDWAFLTFDHRGQGASGGARFWIDHYDTYAQDMGLIIQKVVGARPYLVIGHSMGALISLYGILTDTIKPEGVVLSSPLLGLPTDLMPPKLAYFLSSLLTKLKLGYINTGTSTAISTGFEGNPLTQSFEKFQMIQKDPFSVKSPTFQWVQASYEATQFIADPKNLAKLSIPVLALSGTDERVVDPQAFKRWIDLATTHAKGETEFQWIQGGRHELLFEGKTFYDQAINAISGWMIKKGFLP